MISKTVSALVWSGADRFIQNIFRFIVSIILARLLEPSEFGLIGMIAVVTAIAQSFVDSGFGNALIQKQDANRLDESSVLYFNIFFGIVMTTAIYFSAEYIADFYENSSLVGLTRVMSFNMLINSFSIVQASLLTKELNFKLQTKIGIIATIVSGIAGIISAFAGLGVWSLVIQTLLSNLLKSILLWVMNTWRPLLSISLNSLRSMFRFGSNLLISGIINSIFNNIYNLVIGKVYSAADLGYYRRAGNLERIVVINISHIIGKVIFPLLSSIQDDKLRLKLTLKKAIELSVFLIYPFLTILFIAAKHVIIVLFTEKWLPSVDYLRIVCIMGMFYPLSLMNLHALNAQGKSDKYLKLEIFKKIMMTISIIATYRYGIATMLIAHLLFCTIPAYFINTYYTGKDINYGGFQQVRDILPYLISTLSMGSIIFALGLIFPNNSDLFILTLQGCVGLIAYFYISKLAKLSALRETSSIVKYHINRIKAKKHGS